MNLGYFKIVLEKACVLWVIRFEPTNYYFGTCNYPIGNRGRTIPTLTVRIHLFLDF